jgi:hypothetical protein
VEVAGAHAEIKNSIRNLLNQPAAPEKLSSKWVIDAMVGTDAAVGSVRLSAQENDTRYYIYRMYIFISTKVCVKSTQEGISLISRQAERPLVHASARPFHSMDAFEWALDLSLLVARSPSSPGSSSIHIFLNYFYRQ